eukprot:Hpha_TRINITY_DN15360_c2_g1::TRINITY_DN15360_c2_g1_i4::g.90407::m.90407
MIYGYQDGVISCLVGWACFLLFNCGFLVLVRWKLRKADLAIYHIKKGMGGGSTWDTGRMALFFLGPGEWVSTGNAKLVQRWGLFLEAYSPNCRRFLSAECGLLLVLSVLVVNPLHLHTFQSCGALALVCAAVLMVYTMVCLHLQPWASGYDNLANGVLNILQTLAMGCMGAGFASGDVEHPIFGASEWLLLAVTGATFVKCFFDAVLILVDVLSRRKEALQSSFDASAVMKSCRM